MSIVKNSTGSTNYFEIKDALSRPFMSNDFNKVALCEKNNDSNLFIDVNKLLILEHTGNYIGLFKDLNGTEVIGCLGYTAPEAIELSRYWFDELPKDMVNDLIQQGGVYGTFNPLLFYSYNKNNGDGVTCMVINISSFIFS